MIAIISDSEQESIGKRIYEDLLQKGEEVFFISTSNRDIKPCYSCGGCERKTLGKCVVRDDMDEILPILARATTYIYTTPVVWGGPSYSLKKVLDKSALLGSRFYKVKNGELVKGVNVEAKKLFVIGVCPDQKTKAAKDFIFWGKEVINIMALEGRAVTIGNELSEEKLEALERDVVS